MTDYADIDQISALQSEQANIGQALTILDEYDGTVASCTIVPGVVAPVGVAIVAMTDPAQAMISGVRAGLIQRYNEINRELADLGVTGTPPDQGPPLVEALPA